jgi:hypothetical protein
MDDIPKCSLGGKAFVYDEKVYYEKAYKEKDILSTEDVFIIQVRSLLKGNDERLISFTHLTL